MSKHPSCSSCARFGGCAEPYTCQAANEDPVDAQLGAVLLRLFGVVAFAICAALVMAATACADPLPADALAYRTQHPSAVQPARRRHPSTQTESAE